MTNGAQFFSLHEINDKINWKRTTWKFNGSKPVYFDEFFAKKTTTSEEQKKKKKKWKPGESN